MTWTLPQDYRALTQPQRREVRLQYIQEQRGYCIHCKVPLTDPAPSGIVNSGIDRSLFPASFFDHPIHLHHNHTTGLTIGAVHCHCNAALWQFHGE